MPIPLVIKKELRPPQIDVFLGRAYRESLDGALLEMAVFLQRESPRGISPVGESLKGSWTIIPSRKLPNIFRYEGKIVNTSEAVINRLFGRGPGKFPPFAKGTPLAKWADSKGIPPFLIARKIAREGTERWKVNGNVSSVGLDPRTRLGALANRVFRVALSRELRARGL